MAPSLIELEVVLDRLGVSQGTVQADAVARLLAAVSDEIRRMTKCGFEGDQGATYTEDYRLEDGQRDFTLRHVPVASITSITRRFFDGTLAFTYDAADYRLEDAEAGRVRVWPRSWYWDPRVSVIPTGAAGTLYDRVVYRVTGEIPAGVSQAAEDWVAARWSERSRATGLTSYRTGDDSETYSDARVGEPPKEVARAIAGYFHSTAGGPV